MADVNDDVAMTHLSGHDLGPALALRCGRVPPLVLCEALARFDLWFRASRGIV